MLMAGQATLAMFGFAFVCGFALIFLKTKTWRGRGFGVLGILLGLGMIYTATYIGG